MAEIWEIDGQANRYTVYAVTQQPNTLYSTTYNFAVKYKRLENLGPPHNEVDVDAWMIG